MAERPLLSNQVLASLVPLNTLRPQQLAWLAEQAHQEILHRGRTLWHAGQGDDSCVYLLSGELRLDEPSGASMRVRSGDEAGRHPIDAHRPRQATVRAITDSHIVRFRYSDVDRVVAFTESAGNSMAAAFDAEAQDQAWLRTLMQTPVFYRVSAGNLQEILDVMHEDEVRAGDVVVREGEPGNCCYFIRHGEALVSRMEGSESEHLATLGVGACFGADALLTESPRNATVTMRTDGVLMRMAKQDFLRLLKDPVVEHVGLARGLELVGKGGLWLDVRVLDEYERIHLRGAPSMPLHLMRLKSALLQKDRTYVTYCDTGRRSTAAAYLLSEAGFQVRVLKDGLNALSSAQRAEHCCSELDYVLHRDGSVSAHRVYRVEPAAR